MIAFYNDNLKRTSCRSETQPFSCLIAISIELSLSIVKEDDEVVPTPTSTLAVVTVLGPVVVN